MFLIDDKIFNRAKRGIEHCPFNRVFFQSLLNNSLSAQNVFINRSKYMNEKFLFIKNSNFIENEFLRLIKIGVLRREVDGQGLTSKVRITPIGRKVLENSSNLFNSKKSFIRKFLLCIKYQFTPR
tara:strand:+ start:164 stop:538 length:375 start_codon:yes stop_codon:yes gene_type:complete